MAKDYIELDYQMYLKHLFLSTLRFCVFSRATRAKKLTPSTPQRIPALWKMEPKRRVSLLATTLGVEKQRW
jgi:hypothetical protein